jgi:P-type conjugative transfer protein TrbJ
VKTTASPVPTPCPAAAGGRRRPDGPARRRRRAGPAAAALAVAVLAGALGAAPQPAAAQIPVTDVAHMTANVYWHYAHYVQLAYQIWQHATQIANQLRQIQAQLRALRKLPDPVWRDLAPLLAELDAVVRSGRAIGYALPDAGAQLRQVYPGWTPWTDAAAAPLQTERALDTMRAGLAAIARQAQSLGPAEQALAQIRRQMAATDGHQQALEQLATLSGLTAQEQLLGRQALAVSANLQAVGQAYWIDREAQARAALALVAAETARSAFRSTSRGWTFVPPATLR